MSGKLQDLITLPRSWCPAKTMKEVKNNPIGKRKKQKQQKKLFILHRDAKICVHVPSIRKTQNKNDVNGRTCQIK